MNKIKKLLTLKIGDVIKIDLDKYYHIVGDYTHKQIVDAVGGEFNPIQEYTIKTIQNFLLDNDVKKITINFNRVSIVPTPTIHIYYDCKKFVVYDGFKDYTECMIYNNKKEKLCLE